MAVIGKKYWTAHRFGRKCNFKVVEVTATRQRERRLKSNQFD
jgi:hypothetical protein